MIRLLVAFILIAAVTDTADARRRHRHYDRGGLERSEPFTEGSAPYQDRRLRSAIRYAPRLVDLVPPDWRVQPPDPNWQGKRFVSPDGTSWFAAYSAPADPQTSAGHMKEVTFVDGETITYLQGGRDWIAVSGFKGDRIFYRKATIACSGQSWHHVAFEYPAAIKRAMDPFVTLASASLKNSENEGCTGTVPVAQQPTSPAAPPAGSVGQAR